MKKTVKYTLFSALMGILGIIFCLQLNIVGAQDFLYHSKYFRPYAQLKQQVWENQVIRLKDNRVLLLGPEQSEIFNPYSKSSEMISGWKSVHVFTQAPNLTLLKDGNILVTQGPARGTIGCDRQARDYVTNPKYCSPNKTPLIDLKSKSIRWIPFPFTHLKGHSITLLPSGNLLIVGGLFTSDSTKPVQDYEKEVVAFNKTNIILFNPVNSKYKILGHLQVARQMHKAVMVDSNTLLVFGGYKASTDFNDNINPNPNTSIYSVESIDISTGKSTVIGITRFSPTYYTGVSILDKNRLFFARNGQENGYTLSEIYDVKQGKSTHFLSTKNIGEEDFASNCTPLPNNKIACIGELSVRIIDPVQMTDTYIDRLSVHLSQPLPIYINRIGLLVFGEYRIFSVDHPQKTVQIFNYQRFLHDSH